MNWFTFPFKYAATVKELSATKAELAALKEKHTSLLHRYAILKSVHDLLMDQWNQLVRKINAQGGESFLNGNKKKKKEKPLFDGKDIQRLLMLCHPDKHDGKPMAQEMTRKLLELRG